jgi:hypothetical protein
MSKYGLERSFSWKMLTFFVPANSSPDLTAKKFKKTVGFSGLSALKQATTHLRCPFNCKNPTNSLFNLNITKI